MEQYDDLLDKARYPDFLLLTVDKDGTIRMGLPPRHIVDHYTERARVVGKLENVSHVLCSPEGEMFCVRDGDLYRGPLPSKRDVDWFSVAKRVGKVVWKDCKILAFHPNGELFSIPLLGKFYSGPPPDNENVPWIYEEATQIGYKGWEQCVAICFDPSGNLYTVNYKDQMVKGNPPTGEDYEEWMKSSTRFGERGWIDISYFMSFSPDGKLWCVDKNKGFMYCGFIPDDGSYVANADVLGTNYKMFKFLCFTKDKTISRIMSFEFLPDGAEKGSENPEVIEEKIYDNRGSSITLKHTFTYDKTVKVTSSFSHEHGFTVEVGISLKFEAGIPFIFEYDTTVQITGSTTHTWNFTEINETQEKFSSSSPVEVPPGKAIRMVASVMRAKLDVPYKARVKTLYGFETEIEGIWKGASLYDLRVKQEDYNK